MNGVLIAVGGAKGSRACVAACARLFAGRPPVVILLRVMPIGGPVAADALTDDAELAELRAMIEETPQMKALVAQAESSVVPSRAFLQEHGFGEVRTVIRIGRPTDEIIRAATEYEVDVIVIGNTHSSLDKFFLGDVARQVANMAPVPVLLAR